MPSIGPNLRLGRIAALGHLCEGTRRSLRRSGRALYGRRHTVYGRRHTIYRGRYTARNTGPVILGRATGAAAENALFAEISLLILGIVEHGHLVGELFTVARVIPGEEIVLDPEDLVDGAHERDLASQRQVWVGQHRFNPDVLDVAQAYAEVDVLDVERCSAYLSAVHHAVSHPTLARCTSTDTPTPDGGRVCELTQLCSSTARIPL